MFCANCGSNVENDVVFCPNCGKSPNEVVTTDKDTKIAVGFTVELIRNCFPWVFAAMFWLTVIGGMAGGAKTAQSLYDAFSRYGDNEAGAMVLGGLIGLVVGFLGAVWGGGVVATLLKMDKNLQYLADKEKAKG